MPALYLLGRISIEWNFCEHFIGTLIWHYVGGTFKGAAITANLGNQSKADMLLTLARRFETDAAFVGCVEFATTAFNRLRENRNILMHSHSIGPHESGKLEWRRTSSTAPMGHVGSLVGSDDMMANLNAIAALGFFTLALSLRKFAKRKRQPVPPLPERFPVPDKLTQLPPDVPTNAQRQRKPSRAKSK